MIKLADKLIYDAALTQQIFSEHKNRCCGLLLPLSHFWRYLFIGLLFLSAVKSSGYAFTVSGEMKFQVFSATGLVWVEQDNSFVFTEKDGLWHVEYVPQRFVKFGKEQPLYAYEIASSDGTNIYELQSLDGFPKSTKPYEGRVGSGAIPYGLSDPRLTVLWYAFGSSSYTLYLIGLFGTFAQDENCQPCGVPQGSDCNPETCGMDGKPCAISSCFNEYMPSGLLLGGCSFGCIYYYSCLSGTYTGTTTTYLGNCDGSCGCTLNTVPIQDHIQDIPVYFDYGKCTEVPQ